MQGAAEDEEGGNRARGSIALLPDTVSFLLGPGPPTPSPPKHKDGVGVGVSGEPQDLLEPSLLNPYCSSWVPVLGRAAVEKAVKKLGLQETVGTLRPATHVLLEPAGKPEPGMLPAVRLLVARMAWALRTTHSPFALQLRNGLMPNSLGVSGSSLSGELEKLLWG